MGRRLELHETLCKLLGTRYVYFQPPANVQMRFPCIVYQRTNINTTFADDKPYLHSKKYKITAIYNDPDSNLPDKIAALPKCTHNTHFVEDGLYHDVFTIYH